MVIPSSLDNLYLSGLCVEDVCHNGIGICAHFIDTIVGKVYVIVLRERHLRFDLLHLSLVMKLEVALY